jgi:hypothetical protein
MIVDFQHHFIPRELAKEPAGIKTAIRFDKDGVPSMTPNSVLRSARTGSGFCPATLGCCSMAASLCRASSCTR